MILRCHGCQAALKFDEERLKGRRTARCPRCQTTLDLPAPSPDGVSARAARSPEAVVPCSACGARLRVPSGISAARSRCPRCGSSVSLAAGIERPAAAPPRAAPAEGEENSSAATRRIDSRSIGMSMPSPAPPMPAPPALSSLEPVVSHERGSDASHPVVSGLDVEPAPAVSLTRPPVAPLREAVLDIQAAARAMDPASTVALEPGPATPTPAPSGEPPLSKEDGPAPSAARARATTPPAPPVRASVRGEPRQYIPYPLTRGGFAGLAAGAAVGGALWGAQGWLRQHGFGWLTGPVFAGLPTLLTEPQWRLCLLAVAGGLAGLIAAGAGSPGRHDGPLSIRRCAGSALLPGVLLGMLAILVPSRLIEDAAIWPAVNWMRDLLLVGLLTPAVNRLMPGRR